MHIIRSAVWRRMQAVRQIYLVPFAISDWLPQGTRNFSVLGFYYS